LSVISRLNQKRKNVFYGWRVVAAGTFINAFGIGCFFYGWSTFFKPLENEFGWSRTAISGVSALSRLEGGIEGPIVGWLIDKIGARKMLLLAVAVTGAGFVALSRVHALWSLYVIFGLLSFGFNMGFTFATTAAAAKWFIRKRGRALSFLTAGNGIGGAIFVPVLAWLIVLYGWRWAAIITGIAMWAIVLPTAAFGIRSTPEEMGLLPDGDSAGPGKEPDQTSDPIESVASANEAALKEVDFTWREAMKTQAFWVYAGSMFLRSSILSSLVIHQIPHLTDIGIPEIQAASILGFMVLVSIPGRLAFGWLGDKFSMKVLLFLLCLMQAAGIYIFIHASTMALLYLFVVVYGLGYGGVIPLTWAFRGDLFGRRNFATIAGIMTPLTAAGGIAGPVIAGYVFDVSGSYSVVFYAFMIMISLSGLLFLFIRQPKPPARLTTASITS